jgi:hypothetical protein
MTAITARFDVLRRGPERITSEAALGECLLHVTRGSPWWASSFPGVRTLLRGGWTG